MPLSKFASLQGPGQSKFANLQFFSRKILLKSSFTFQSWPSLQVCKFAPIFWARFASLQVCKFKGGGIYFDQDLISQVFEFASFGRQNLDANHGYRLNFVSQNLKTCKLAAGANLQTCSVCKLANLQTCFIHNFANLQTCSWVQTCKLAMSVRELRKGILCLSGSYTGSTYLHPQACSFRVAWKPSMREQDCKFASLHHSKFASLQVCTLEQVSSLQVCATEQVCKFTNFWTEQFCKFAISLS